MESRLAELKNDKATQLGNLFHVHVHVCAQVWVLLDHDLLIYRRPGW